MESKKLMKVGSIVVVVLMIVGWLVSSYNSMVSNQEEVTTAWSNVEAAYQRRADMMPQLAKIVKSYAKHERETFEQVTKARNAATQIHLDAADLTPEKIKAFEQTQNQVTQALSRLIAVSERYNESVQGYNLSIRRFPNNLLAGMYGFERMTKFEAAQGAEKAPDLDI